jgi:hypothetical protein
MNDTTQHEFEDQDGTERDDTERDGAERDAAAERDDDEQVVDEPVLDGATEHQDTDVDPRKGLTDPALIRDIDAEKKTVNPYG